MLIKKVEEALNYIETLTSLKAKTAIILGSGLGGFADTLNNKIKIPNDSIPHYPRSTVEGHQGNLVFGQHKNISLIAVQGRTHFYEGYTLQEVTFIVRIMKAAGVKVLLVTNAAGGVNPCFTPGDLMLITDQVNFFFSSPLSGKNEFEGPRFPDMSDAYAAEYFDQVEQIALDRNIPLRRGVLFSSSGPSYETASEVKMLQKIGADAASMSTIPEVIAANHAGIKVIGISCITNFATGISPQKLTHEEVTQTAELVKEKFLSLVSGIIVDIFSKVGG